jgi:hypothetical protein
MREWLAAHKEVVDFWVGWALYVDAFRMLSAFMYVVFDVGLLALGAKYHDAVVRKSRPVGNFPPGYFTMLVIQTFPMTVTGFVLNDLFIIGTRTATLAVALVVYGMINSRDGSFDTSWHRLWALFWLSVAVLGAMAWSDSASIRKFVQDWEKWISWSAVAAMLVFVVKGQLAVAKQLFRHFLVGNYSIKRFSLQLVRLLCLAPQAAHYWLAPSGAEPLLGLDPIFLSCLLGTIGVIVVLIGSIVGMIRAGLARLWHNARSSSWEATPPADS